MKNMCGCCEGLKKLTPIQIVNRPGLDRLSYRVGTHATFLQTMTARLTDLFVEVSSEEVGSWLLVEDDLTNPASFAEKLNKGRDALARYLRAQLSSKTQAFLDSLEDPEKQASSLRTVLINELNKIIQRESLYEDQRFSNVFLTKGIRDLIGKQTLKAEEIARLNRLFLEVTYPNEIASRQRIYPLRSLTIRSSDDPSIAMLDTWATVADVLSFYQERIANEGYLRTATERRSILELARLVGYRLHPGVAASVYLAFTLEEDYQLEIPAGTRAQSVPGPEELPQFFETSEALYARAEWNNIRPRLTRPQIITQDIEDLYIQGTATNLKANDPLLVFGEYFGKRFFHRVATVEVDPEKNVTHVKLQSLPVESAATQVLGVIEQYENLQAFKLSDKVAMVGRVMEWMGNIKEKISPEVSTEVVADVLKEILPDLKAEKATADLAGYTRLKPWVGGLVAGLESIVVRRIPPPFTAKEPEGFGETDDRIEDSILSKLSGLEYYKPLLQSPSLQPANALKLPRSVGETFAYRADSAPRLQAELLPRLKPLIYKVAAAAEVTEPGEASVHAMRLNVAPFGHNAPLKPVYDEQGRIVDNKEWPLAEASLFKISVELSSPQSPLPDLFRSATSLDYLNIIDVKVLLSDADQSWISTRKLYDPDQGPIAIGNLTFDIVLEFIFNPLGAIEGVSVTLNFSSSANVLVKTIRFLWSNTTGMSVLIDQETESHIEASQKVSYVISNRRIEIEFARDGRTLAVFDESINEVDGSFCNILVLDNQYGQIMPESWCVVKRQDEETTKIYKVLEVNTISKAAYGMTGRVTQLTLDQPWLGPNDRDISVFRKTSVFAQSERLELAEEPIDTESKPEPIQGDSIELNDLYDGLEVGQWVVVSGERADVPGVKTSELMMIAGIDQGFDPDLPGDKLHTTLLFDNALSYSYKRDSCVIYGNVVKATHGETRQEVLGSGDGTQALQSFTLSQLPLTYVAAATPAGIQSTLEARVNDILWYESDNMFMLGPYDRGYITRTDDADKTTVIFGNGKHGTRLPTGIENVRAVYRFGIGKSGNIAAEQISILATKPLGVKEVINPLPASGGADRECRDQARLNTPLSSMALNRLVSVQDYADFARTFAAIAKASATRLSDGRRQIIHVTIAGQDDIPIDKSSDLYQNLLLALYQSGDPNQTVQVALRELMLLIITAKVRIKKEYQWEKVEPQIRSNLLNTFGFKRQQLGQDVPLSKVISVIQNVPGVAYVDVDILDNVSESFLPAELEQLATTLELKNCIEVEMSRIEVIDNIKYIKPAQIAYLSPNVPDTLILQELTL